MSELLMDLNSEKLNILHNLILDWEYEETRSMQCDNNLLWRKC